MILEPIDYHKVKTAFQKELKLTEAGKPSSLSFIKHSLPEKPLITNGIFQGIVIGGTNYVDSTRRILKNGGQKTVSSKYGTIPVFTDKQILVDFLMRHLNHKADVIGLNFGFPMKPVQGPFGEIDGKILHGTKEHTFNGVTTPVGDIVRDIYKEQHGKSVLVSIANDSVCLTLSGEGSEHGSLIVGTGCNMCLRLTKNDKTIVVNLEAGNFNKFPHSAILKKLDKASAVPGGQLLEKVVSGQYLADYFNEAANKAGIKIPPLETTRDVSDLAAKRSVKPETLLAREIMQRSACLVAAITAGAYEFLDRPHEFTIITEGSVFWKGWKYQENVAEQLEKLGIPANAIIYKHIRDSSIKGAIGLITKQ